MMDNRPEFIFTWLGLVKIGVCVSLINTNLTGKPLIHSLSVCGATHAIIGKEYSFNIIKNHRLIFLPDKNRRRTLRENFGSQG